MKRNKLNKLRILTSVCLPALVLILAACSTTKRLEEGEVLYTGVKNFNLSTPEGVKHPGDMEGNLKTVINVKPNNPMPFLSPYVRTPFPIGLWVDRKSVV